jgi:hypothetical protein
VRAFHVFARMRPERACEVLSALREKAPGVYTQAVAAASAAMRARPRFLMAQPEAKRAELVRRTLSRVAAAQLAEEVLAAYFLDVRRDLLVEWLDAVGVAHREGTLKGADPPPPPKEKLEAALAGFRRDEDRADRELLLEAFAAQSAVDWPDLEAALPRPA